MRERLFKEEELSGGGEGLFKEKVRRGLERKGREAKGDQEADSQGLFKLKLGKNKRFGVTGTSCGPCPCAP